MGNPFGRNVIVPLTNKSGASVAAGDLVYVGDGATADSFTTGTTANRTGMVGIAQATIASNAVGLVLVGGYASLVNVNASVTINHFGASYTVAKQATDVGAARAAGTCLFFLTGGTTPDAILWQPDLGAGSGAMTLITDTLMGSDTASFDFTSIPGTYKHLKILISGRSTKAGTTTDFATMKFNNDGSSIYDSFWFQTFNGSLISSNAEDIAAASFPHFLLLPAATSDTGATMSGEITIPDYASTTLHKSWHNDHYAPLAYSTGNSRRCFAGGDYRATTAISRITIATGGNWKAGSRASLYGIS